jgi:hypothetical protein
MIITIFSIIAGLVFLFLVYFTRKEIDLLESVLFDVRTELFEATKSLRETKNELTNLSLRMLELERQKTLTKAKK